VSLAAIQRALLEARARRLSSEHPVWEVSAPWWPFSRRARRYEEVLVEMLAAAARLPSRAYLVIDENPQEYDVGGAWAHAQLNTWVVPEGCDLGVLQDRVLGPGGWTLYCRPEPVEPDRIPDFFRALPSEIASFATALGIPVAIEAFYDNDPWRVWVEDVSERMRAAA
jgi:hypothetical protein